ncbi:hypothetical protein THRCLA_20392 [Thraustotheca clavata]|uniref:Mbre TPR repeat protein n=1 Tax=Thraustotheca clavata TaxID=74557 RepID=A0A1W0A837_9STRA|nr:hypothetical protein THRCLA_20392 [Thraustotheca clavata]
MSSNSFLNKTDQPDGLTLSYSHQFIDIHGGRTAFQGLTTAQVCYQFVAPYTTDSKLSLVDHVRLNNNDVDYVKPATWYISHAWSYIFLEDEPVLWFCVFANNQHRAAEIQFAWWQSTFKQSLEAIGNVLMILHPWNNPVTSTLSWCIFEVYVSILVGANFQVAMASNQATVFFDDLLADFSSFYNMLLCINSNDAKSTMASDKESIDEVIEAEVGFVALDRMVLDRFEKWMFNYTLPDATEAYKIYLEELEPDNPKTLVVQRIFVLRPQEEREPILVNVIAKLEKNLEPMQQETLCCMLHLGHLYGVALQSPAKSVKILHVAYTRLNEVYGPKSHHTLYARMTYILNQSAFLDNETSLRMMNECKDDITFAAISFISTMQISKCDHEKELEAYKTCCRLFGENHMGTLDASANLALAFYREGMLDLAIKQADSAMTTAHGIYGGVESIFYG